MAALTGLAPIGQERVTFVVPATAGGYAPERMRFGIPASGQVPEFVRYLSWAVEASVADADVELWLLKVNAGGPDYINSDFFDSAVQIDAPGTLTTVDLRGGWPGVEIRVKSGGTGGSLVLNACASK